MAIHFARAVTVPWASKAQPNAVRCRFVAGYSTAPEPIKQAIKILISHWFEAREPVVIGATVNSVPMSVNALAYPYQVSVGF